MDFLDILFLNFLISVDYMYKLRDVLKIFFLVLNELENISWLLFPLILSKTQP